MDTILEKELTGSVYTLWLNDPASRNSLSPAMVTELIHEIEHVINTPSIRVLVIRGRGDGFCSGANLVSFAQKTEMAMELDVLRESRALANLFLQLNSLPKPVVSVVHGYAFGGAIGLIAASDYILADPTTLMAFSEVKLGLVPATILPYVAQRMKEGKIRELMLTGKRFTAEDALDFGLISEITPTISIPEKLKELLGSLLEGAPLAQGICKTLILETRCNHSFHNMADHTSKVLAEMRLAEEAKEGIAAFLEKRKAKFNRCDEL